MKKSLTAVIISLAIVLCASFGVYFVLNWNNIFPKTYSESFCLNDRVTEDMSRIDIARLYTDSCVSVIVKTTSPTNSHAYQALGSGVCIASKGYGVNEDYVASKGSYIVTNYHVISWASDPIYKNYTTEIKIELNRSSDRYKANLLWADKDLDMAILYCDESLEIGWIEMQDRVVACDSADKINYDEIFVIGTPLDIQYKNTLTLGNISNNNLQMVEGTATELYTYTSNGVFKYTTDKEAIPTYNYQTHQVLDNIYENVVMMNCDITNGNSGGGVFDKYGNLIGLATLGKDYTSSGTASMNFMVSIYPATLVLNKLILKNEGGIDLGVYTFDNLGLTVIDSVEATNFGEQVMGVNGSLQYYMDGVFYPKSQYASAFAFDGTGVYILNNVGRFAQLQKDFIITKADKNDLKSVDINTRNDLIYFLLNCNSGERINIYGTFSNGQSRSFTIEF